MISAARRQAALEILELIDSTGQSADRAVAGYLRGRRYIGGGDRRAILEQVYGVLRGQARLDWWILRAGGEVGPRTRLLAWLALTQGETLESLAQDFLGQRHGPQPLNESEKNLLRYLDGKDLSDGSQSESVAFELPEWAVGELRAGLGDRFEQEAAALREPAAVDLRVNTLKSDRETARRALAAEGVEAAPTLLSPLGLRLETRKPIAATKVFSEGMVEVQDEGSQLVVQLVEAAPGLRVVDFCAGAGGKTLALAADMENKGQLLALDVSEGRLRRAKARFRRSGAHNIETRTLRNERDPWLKRRKQAFDRVLVDAPCSGSGTWRRNPDAKWRLRSADLETLADLQGRILESAARLVKPGGRLVYATCSLFALENEKRVEAFLEAHPDFSLLPASEVLPRVAEGRGDSWLKLLPGRDGTDGFFAAVLRREDA